MLFVDPFLNSGVSDSVYSDEEDWWGHVMASGDGMHLKALNAEILNRFKASAYQSIQEFKRQDGIHRPYKVIFLSARKP